MINKELWLSIKIDDDLVDRLIRTGRSYYPNEFGGFLVGYYSEDFKLLNITDTILPKKYKATKNLFERDTLGIEEVLMGFFKEIPQKYYVGEWHTHPNNLPIPSNTDLKAISAIVNHNEVSIKNPIFLIIGYNKTEAKLGFYVPFENKLFKYD